jgi:hypothetical protein
MSASRLLLLTHTPDFTTLSGMSSRAKKKQQARPQRLVSNSSTDSLPPAVLARLDKLRADLRPHLHNVVINGVVGGLQHSLEEDRRKLGATAGDETLPEPSPELMLWLARLIHEETAPFAAAIGETAARLTREARLELSLMHGPSRRRWELEMRGTLEPLTPGLLAALDRARERYRGIIPRAGLDALLRSQEVALRRTLTEIAARPNRPDPAALERLAARMRRSIGFRNLTEMEESGRMNQLGVGVPDALRRAAIETKADLDLSEPLLIWANYATYVAFRKHHGDYWEIPTGMPDPFAEGAPPPSMATIIEAFRNRVELRVKALVGRDGAEAMLEILSEFLNKTTNKCLAREAAGPLEIVTDDPPPGYVKFLREDAERQFPGPADEWRNLFQEIWIDAGMTLPTMRHDLEAMHEHITRESWEKARRVQQWMFARSKGQA